MAKHEKQYPSFECTEYDYGNVSHRAYRGSIHATLKFADGMSLYFFFEFKEFLDYHKRKKTDFFRVYESVYSQMNGWGSRYFELIELLQDEDEIDLFELFAEYIELTEPDFAEKYEAMRIRINKIKLLMPTEPEIVTQEEDDEEDDEDEDEDEEGKEALGTDEINQEEVSTLTPVVEEEEDEDEESPYDRDRGKFHELLKEASDDMFDTLKIDFLPQMEYFQRRYPTKWKSFMENLEDILQNFEDEMLEAMFPLLDENEYREYDIKYNSQKADMSEEDEPPTAR